MNNYIIYSDGSCKSLGKRGGWSAIICDEANNILRELYGGYTNTTSNRMEIYGVLQGLSYIEESANITVISDSQYVVNTVNGNWILKMLQDPDNYANMDLWTKLNIQLQYHNVTMVWTKGHANNKMNNLADKLAQFVANALNLPEDEHTNISKENRKPLVSEYETWRSDGFNSGQKNGTPLYSLG